MSEPWIKMRTSLATNPKVVRLSIVLNMHVGAVCGACFMLWCAADAHSVGGELPGYDYDYIDRMVGVSGFCKAAESVGWVALTSKGVSLPHFGVHNGETAKRRSQGARRASRFRNAGSNAPVTPASRFRNAPGVTFCAPDKRRLEKRTTATGRAGVRTPGDAAAAGLSPEDVKARTEYLTRRPDWLPEGLPWIDDEAAGELARLPALTQTVVDKVIRTARAGRRTLANPAGLVIARLRRAGRGPLGVEGESGGSNGDETPRQNGNG